MSVLIVNEKDETRNSIRAMLKANKQGKYFFESSNGKDAWAFLERFREPLHLIISDLDMPKMNGTVLLSKVRASKKYRYTPFLMVAKETYRSQVANAAENEVDAYLAKPFNPDTLRERIAELMENASNPSKWSKH